MSDLEQRLSSLGGMLAGDHHRLDQTFQAIVAHAYGGAWQQLEVEWIPFQRELLDHLDAEEHHIIPALAQDRPAAAATLLAEHGRIRLQLTELGVDLDLHCVSAERIWAFVDTLRSHAEREERTFYPWSDGDATPIRRPARPPGRIRPSG